MKESVINQLLSGARADMRKVVISESYKQEYIRFEANCKEFKKKIAEKVGEEEAPELLQLFDKTMKAYVASFQELAECYFEEGFRRGFLLAKDLLS